MDALRVLYQDSCRVFRDVLWPGQYDESLALLTFFWRYLAGRTSHHVLYSYQSDATLNLVTYLTKAVSLGRLSATLWQVACWVLD